MVPTDVVEYGCCRANRHQTPESEHLECHNDEVVRQSGKAMVMMLIEWTTAGLC